MSHPDHAIGYEGSLKDLAQEVGNMRYDSLAEFMKYLSDNLSEQATKDQNNKPQLAAKVEESASQLNVASLEMYQAWKVAEPHMKSKK